MNQRQYLLKGTFLLTLTGLITRAAGFLYKIFLSRTIGAASIGLFQMTLPFYSFALMAASGGIQTAISHFTAEYTARYQKKHAFPVLFGGILLSGCLSVPITILLYSCSDTIARIFLKEISCALLIRILAVSLPFCVLHGCINGYFIGLKKVVPSSAAQLTEQMVRICSVLLFYLFLTGRREQMTAAVMALGQLAGEMAASIFCIFSILRIRTAKDVFSFYTIRIYAKKIAGFSAPLALNRMLLSVLQGIEAALLPQQLQQTGLSSASALSAYGTLTGMSIPLILFPTAVSSALGTLILPVISEAAAQKDQRRIHTAVQIITRIGLLLGLLCMILFLLSGQWLGAFLFGNPLAGNYIRILSAMCPFLYLTSTLTGILHGLGKAGTVFLLGTFTFSIRLLAVIFLVPVFGMPGYLSGMILGQFLHAVCIFLILYKAIR